jgi:steroid delta-isomerase-like uncharacterized protein
VIAAWNSHDPAAMTELLAPHGVFEGIPIQRHYRQEAGGLQEQVRWIDALSSDYVFRCLSSFRAGDVYFLEWEITGTNDGAYEPFGLPATGKTFEVRGAALLVTDGDQIERGAMYYDLWGLFAQIGLPQTGPFAWPLVTWMEEWQRTRPAPIE